jgi:hypothetical protein
VTRFVPEGSRLRTAILGSAVVPVDILMEAGAQRETKDIANEGIHSAFSNAVQSQLTRPSNLSPGVQKIFEANCIPIFAILLCR